MFAENEDEFTPQFDDDMRPRQRRRVARRSEATEPRSGRKRPRNQTLVKTSTGIWQVAYNGENRPVSWTCGSTNITMKFDRMGRRVEYVEMVNGNTNTHHRFVYDGYLCVQRLNGASNNAVELAFGWDPTESVATRPLWIQRVSGTYNFFYVHDGNKNVSELVSYQTSRGVPAHYEYAPFGAVTVATTNTAFTAFDVASTNPFRFSSEYTDGALGLVYYNYRHYDWDIGRWLTREQIEEIIVVSRYAFVYNNSLWYYDLLGNLPKRTERPPNIPNNAPNPNEFSCFRLNIKQTRQCNTKINMAETRIIIAKNGIKFKSDGSAKFTKNEDCFSGALCEYKQVISVSNGCCTEIYSFIAEKRGVWYWKEVENTYNQKNERIEK